MKTLKNYFRKTVVFRSFFKALSIKRNFEKMNKMTIVLLLCITPVNTIMANEDETTTHSRTTHITGNHISLGFTIQEWDEDLGGGLQLTSPWFLYEKAAVRLSGSVLYKENVDWTPYSVLRLGFLGGSFMRTADIRLYGEGGILLLFPNSKFDDDTFVFGGYGHFGFEFFLAESQNPLMSYIIELGTNGVGAKTNKGDMYLNGFALSAGLRLYF